MRSNTSLGLLHIGVLVCLLVTTAVRAQDEPVAPVEVPITIDPAAAAAPAADPAAAAAAAQAAAAALPEALPAGIMVASTEPGAVAIVDIPVRRRRPRRSVAPPLTSAPSLPTDTPVAGTATGPTLQAIKPLYQGNLDLHNSYRARHQDTPPLVWDDSWAASAAAYASKCIWDHDPTNNGQWGENLYASSVYSNPVAQQAQGVKAWYDEISAYDFNKPGFSGSTGHFTQVVWKSSTALGCAVAKCPNGMTGWTSGRLFLVCRYFPPGNYLGEFSMNVMRLKKSTTPSPAPTPPPSPRPSPRPSPSPSPRPSPSPAPATPTATVVAAGAFIAQSGTTSAQLATGPNCRASPNNIYSLCQRDTGRVELMKVGRTSAIWWGTPNWTNTYINNNRPFSLRVDAVSGRLTIYTTGGTAAAAFSATAGTAPFSIYIQNNGNVRILDHANVVVWSTNTAGF